MQPGFVNEGIAIVVQDTGREKMKMSYLEDMPARAVLLDNGFICYRAVLTFEETLVEIDGLEKTAENYQVLRRV